MFDVISIGSATLDVFLHCQSLMLEKEDGQKEICVPYGTKVEVEEILFETGGGGTNSAVTFRRQGLTTAVIAKIGDDFAGKKIIKELKREKIRTRLVKKDKKEITDYSTILWAPDGGRTILVYRGKTRLEVKDIPWNKLQTKWFYISSIEGNLKIISEARSQKPEAKIAWNPGKRELKQKDKVLKRLPYIEVLILNKEEVKRLLSVKPVKQLTAKQILQEAQKLPCRLILITDGKNGSYFWDRKNWYHSGVYKTVQVETTGAGDAYGSAFVAGMIKGFSFDKCLQLAAANAASIVSSPGAKKGLLRTKDLNNYLKKKLILRKLF